MQNLDQSFDPWRETPRKFIVILLLSVFVLFTIIGVVNDFTSMGRPQAARFVIGVVLSGGFAVLYASTGIALRKNWWKGVAPVFVLQVVIMSVFANIFPDRPQPASMSAQDLAKLRVRFAWDSTAIIIAVSLGYTGFLYVAVH